MPLGADAFGLQVEKLENCYHNSESYKKIFEHMQGKPVYVTNYAHTSNQEKTYDEIAEELVGLAESGATLCDVMGDFFDKHPEELTDNNKAIDKQMKLIEKLHNAGAEVLMSSHVLKFTPAERVVEIAHEQVRRGADIVKIVTGAESMEQQIENLRIAHLLKKELKVPYLFLSGGESRILRRIGPMLGCSMYLCVLEHDELSTKAQPVLKNLKAMYENFNRE